MPDTQLLNQPQIIKFDGWNLPGYEVTTKFDASMDIPSGVLRIVVRLDWSNVTNFTNKGEFVRRYIDMIEKYWSGRYHVRINRGGPNVPPLQIDLLPEIKLITTQNNPHYGMNVGYMRTGASFVNNDTCNIIKDDVKAKQTSFKMNLGFRISHVNTPRWGYHRTVYKAAKDKFKQAVGQVPYPVNTTDANQVANQLRPLGQHLLQDLPLFPLIPIILTSRWTPTESVAVGTARVTSAKNYLVGMGVPQSQLEMAVEPTTKASPYLEIKLDKSFKDEYVNDPHSFPIAAHEFGHMLGLFDEYFGLDQGANAYGSRLYLASCNAMNVPTAPFDSNNLSIMSMGYLVFPCHYVPFADAVKRMIANYFARKIGSLQSSFDTLRVGDPGRPAAANSIQTARDLSNAYTVTVAPTPLKDGPDQTERISYMQWINGLY